MDDPHDLDRFVDAQAPVYGQALAELASGRKRSHWMWFVFPQLRGLGRSETARRFGIASQAEASAYLRHPVLGPRLRACVAQLLALPPRTANEIFDSPDDLKLRSCLTLFDAAAHPDPLFRQGLDRYFGGEPDPATLALLAQPCTGR